MSSASIMTEIGHCQNQINALSMEILKLKEKIESQEFIHRSFITKQEYYRSELADKNAKKNKVSIYQNKVVVSHRFQERTNDTMNMGKVNAMMGQLDAINTKLKSETKQHIDRLGQLEQNLRNANSQLSQLQTEYQNALATEEAERQRAEEERLRHLQNKR